MFLRKLASKIRLYERKITKLYRDFQAEREDSIPLEIFGLNWVNETNKPVAIFIGFNPWKRPVFSSIIDDYRCAFTRRTYNWKSIISEVVEPLGVDEVTVVTWGAKKLPKTICIWRFLNEKFSGKKIIIKHLQVEDGFLRTIGRGQLHTSPASLCFDDLSIYFDANKPSRLEKIIQETDLSNDSAKLKRAQLCMEIFNKARLTKYYDVDGESYKNELVPRDKYSILVIGQVEDDASIKNGKSKFKYNTDLVLQAKKDFPEADIYYKPHPDYIFGNRKQRSRLSKVSRICKIVPDHINLSEIIDKVDHVYVMTSLAGFESLLRGKKVTTCGLPFYSGWGVTNDLVPCKRRNKYIKAKEDLFYAAYLEYSKYYHLETDELIEFEEQSSYFIVEVLKYKDIFDLPNDPFFTAISQYKEHLSVPFKLLAYLSTTKLPSEADNNELDAILDGHLCLRDFGQISYLLIKTSNYDYLIKYTNMVLNSIGSNVDKISIRGVSNFFSHLSLVLKNSNGRVVNGIPNLSSYFLEIKYKSEYFDSLILNYFDCCALNIQYENILDLNRHLLNSPGNKGDHVVLFSDVSRIIADKLSFNIGHGTLRKLISRVKCKPSRSERNYDKRYLILQEISEIYKSKLSEVYDEDISDAYYYSSREDFEMLSKTIDKFVIKDLFSRFNDVKYNSLWLPIISSLIKANIDTESVNKLYSFFFDGEFIISNDKWARAHLDFLILKKSNAFSFFLNEYMQKYPDSDLIKNVYISSLKNEGRFDLAIKEYTLQYEKSDTLTRKQTLRNNIDKLVFCSETSKLLKSVPQPSIPKGIVFIASQNCYNSLAMLAPCLLELKKKGYVVINLMEGLIEYDMTKFDWINKFVSAIPSKLVNSSNLNDLENIWEIDWNNKRVVSESVNYYQGFYERISTYIRSYYVDISKEHQFREFKNQLLRSDLALNICKSIYDELVIGKNMNVTFVTSNSHVTPYSIFRDFARAKNDPRMGFINCNVAYESYFSNLGSKFSSTMCVTDMTLYPTLRAPFFARRDQFETWYEKNSHNEQFLNQANSLINVNRVHSNSDSKQDELVKKLKNWKNEGYKIICAFGKVPVDLNVPFDGGPAHEDMADWLNHTVKICSGKDKLILLVKPHPHELKPQIALDLIEGFNNLVNVDYEDNVLLLGHRDINVHALAPYLDLALLYNGSSSLELTAMGIPVVMAAYFGRYDYPVDLIYPESRQQYEDFILAGNYPKPCEELRKKAAFLICYMGTDEISITNDYSLRQLTNDKVGVPRWRRNRIDELLLHGDPKMKLIADRIVEKFEKTI
ncbi:hypothetical protein P0F10_002565 [Vibrio metschnikovii]|nr:hypothetical protein [Vibrio metschnikovii]